jgi:hypothetical protein
LPLATTLEPAPKGNFKPLAWFIFVESCNSLGTFSSAFLGPSSSSSSLEVSFFLATFLAGFFFFSSTSFVFFAFFFFFSLSLSLSLSESSESASFF